MKTVNIFLTASIVCLALLSCKKEPSGKPTKDDTGGKRGTLTLTPISELNRSVGTPDSHAAFPDRYVLSPVAGTYVQLDKSVLMEEKPVYPRFTQAPNGDYLMFYHYGNASTWAGNECELLRSKDLVNWSYVGKPFAVYAMTDCTGASNKRGYAGAHLVTLSNGDVLAVASTRAISKYRERAADNGLSIRISHDSGYSWDPEILVLVGTNWEPMPVILPSGRIQIYYTDSQKINENVFGDGSEVISTGSSYIYSDDNGKTWIPNSLTNHLKGFRQIRYKGDKTTVYTDQMPAVAVLGDGKTLAAAAESFIGGSSYKTYISLAWSDANGDWGSPDAQGIMPERRKNNFIEGCAPYLVHFNSGETVLFYNRSNVFYMRQGDAGSDNFGEETKVFPQTAATGKGFWGSGYLADSHRMVAAVGGTSVIQMGQFYLNHAIKASSHAVKVDGNNSDWKTTDEALYICSLGETTATVRCSADAQNIYFLVEVSDKDISRDDYFQIFLSDASKDKIGSSSFRIKASHSGLKNAGNYAGGWRDKDFGAVVSAVYDGTISYNADTDNGYLLEVSVPRKSLNITDGMLLANFALFDIRNGGEDAIVPTVDTSTSRWIPILGL